MKMFSLVSKATSTVSWISLCLAVANAAALTGRQSSQNIAFCEGLDGTACETPIQLEGMFGVCMPQLLSGASSVATAGQIACVITTGDDCQTGNFLELTSPEVVNLEPPLQGNVHSFFCVDLTVQP